jgi:hypothetical protein
VVGSTPHGAPWLGEVQEGPRYLQMLGTPAYNRDHMIIM